MHLKILVLFISPHAISSVNENFNFRKIKIIISDIHAEFFEEKLRVEGEQFNPMKEEGSLEVFFSSCSFLLHKYLMIFS